MSYCIYVYIHIWYNIFRSCQYTTVFGNVRLPRAARAIWTKMFFEKGEGTFLHFPASFLSVFRFSSFSPFLRLARPLSRIWRDRYCFLFPRGTLGQFQIAEITERVEANVRMSAIFGRGRGKGGERERKRERGDPGGHRRGIVDRSGIVSQFPQSTRYERFPRANIRAFLLRRTSCARPRC